VTILLMVLLSILALGMLSISTVTLRSTSRSDAMAEARANARMALMMAIGELQKQMGPDQRISANAAILDGDPETEEIDDILHKHWVGVWESWKAGGTTGSAHSTIQGVSEGDMHPDYPKKRADNSADGYFRSWLVSLPEGDRTSIGAATNPVETLLPSLNPDKDTNSVFLVHEGSLGDLNDTSNPNDLSDSVAAGLIEVEPDGNPATPAGRYAWWVGDESQKARVMTDSYAAQTSLTSAETIFRAQAPASTGTKAVTGLENISDDSQIETLPSLNTLDLVDGVTGRPARKNFHSVSTTSLGVLSDVREGGLKRDLSTLLERPIDPAEKGDEFMLYKFNTKDSWASIPAKPPGEVNPLQEAVPIQDLAAYYQLYDNTRRGGIQYSAANPPTIQATAPNYGTTTDYKTSFQREYTTLYRNPIPIKVQYLLSLAAEPIQPAERSLAVNAGLHPTDEFKLRIGLIPAITFWNPNNVPIVMQSGNLAQHFRIKAPAFFIKMSKKRPEGDTYSPQALNLGHAAGGGSVGDGRGDRKSDMLRIRFAGTAPITFQPGEVRIFSPAYDGSQVTTFGPATHEATPGWKAKNFIQLLRSTSGGGGDTAANNIVKAGGGARSQWSLSFKRTDEFTVSVGAETGNNLAETVSGSLSPIGVGIHFYLLQNNYAGSSPFFNLRNYSFTTRFGGSGSPNNGSPAADFTNPLLKKGMPGGVSPILFEPIQGTSIVNASNGGESLPLLQFALMAGSETNELSNGGALSGRKFASRPFLHSSPIQPAFIDQLDNASQYNYGWNWWIEGVNSVLEALVGGTESGNGYYGGGYDLSSGTTHVIQQEIPVVPPISLAALSHAHLGGFSLANEAPAGHGNQAGEHEGSGGNVGDIDDPTPTKGFQRVTATGQGGSFRIHYRP